MSNGAPTRRHRAASAERLPLPVLALAVAAVIFFALPFIGLLWRAPWSSMWAILTDRAVLTALRLSLVTTLWATALSVVFGVPLAWLLARVDFPGRGRRARPLHAVDGPAAGRRRRGAVLRRRPSRAVRPVPRPVVRAAPAVHHRGCRRRPDVRGDAVPRAHGRRLPCASSIGATTMPLGRSARARGTDSAG